MNSDKYVCVKSKRCLENIPSCFYIPCREGFFANCIITLPKMQQKIIGRNTAFPNIASLNYASYSVTYEYIESNNCAVFSLEPLAQDRRMRARL
jgi:hypothetical protein